MAALATGLSSLLGTAANAIGIGRRRARAASEARFRDFATIAAEWFWETDASLRFSYVSSRMQEHVGLSPEVLLGRSASELGQELGQELGDTSLAACVLQEAMEAHRSFDDIEWVRRVGDRRRVLSISARALRDRRGRFIGYRGIGRDVTAERRSLRAARESEEKLRTLVDALPVCIAYIDRDMRYRLNNETFRTWFGLDPDSLRGRRIDTVLGEAAFEESRLAIECALLGEAVTLEESVRDASGTCREVQTTFVPHRRESDVAGLFVLSQDVSDRKRHVDHLAQSRRYLTAVLDGLDAGIVVLDASATLRLANAAWYGLAGESGMIDGDRGIRYADTCSTLALGAPEDTRRAIATVEAHARGEGRPVRAEVRFPRVGAADLWLAISTSEFVEAGERCVLVAHRDISEQVRLARRVRAQDHALARTVRLDSLGELAATVAHELNQPLTSIGNYAAIALDTVRRAEPRDERLHTTLERLLGETRRSGAIVHRVSNFVRQRPVERREASIESTVRDVVDWLRDQLLESEVTLSVCVAAALPPLHVDVTQLEQVLYNLLGNAIEAIAEADTDGGRVRVQARVGEGGEMLIVRVTDSGPGPSAEIRESLFEPFVTSRSAGLGLGLAICRSIIESHGGRIWHERPEGGGDNVFGFALPIERTDSEEGGG